MSRKSANVFCSAVVTGAQIDKQLVFPLSLFSPSVQGLSAYLHSHRSKAAIVANQRPEAAGLKWLAPFLTFFWGLADRCCDVTSGHNAVFTNWSSEYSERQMLRQVLSACERPETQRGAIWRCARRHQRMALPGRTRSDGEPTTVAASIRPHSAEFHPYPTSAVRVWAPRS